MRISKYAVQRLRPVLFRLTPRTRMFRFRAALLRRAGYDVAPTAQCVSTVQFHAPNVSLAAGVFCAHEVRFFGGPSSQISIGTNVQVGPQVCFVARTHHLGPSDYRAGDPKDTTITVGPGAWIGARVVIVGPSRVGEGAVIAAGASVRGDVPPNVLWFGSPHQPPQSLP
jgi:acetyltransferase-like isoleucine patch superfamily enzyme